MNTLGIDIGSVSLSAALVDRDGHVHATFVTPHEGDIAAAMVRLDRGLDLASAGTIAATGRPTPGLSADLRVDSRVACITSVRHRYPDARAILLVGGEFFSLIRFDAAGEYIGVRTNTSCAAGTGSFLDQQAGRLNLDGSAHLARIALANEEASPQVATRCAVFAKTDLIHAQQEGYSVSAISAGLCRGVARNLVDTLFKDLDLIGPIVFTGGVSRNEAVFEELRTLVDHEVIRDDRGQFQGAIGAALEAHASAGAAPTPPGPLRVTEGCTEAVPDRSSFYPPLSLQRSDYPDFAAHRHYDHPILGRLGQPFVEVDVYRAWPQELQAYLGIDIGSTSTKAVLTTHTGDVVAGFYTRTAGRPLEAVQALFETIADAARREESLLTVIGSATTGSGRKFIGRIIGADEILDEISAHARAAVELDPAVDTILEIGGQDAKFTTLRHGRVTMSIMNNVCAAGTGSFLEEQGKRLGVNIRDFAARTEGVRAPMVSDRCTVFMDRDINHLLSEGHSVPEVLAAALHGVRENYLRKVAVERSIEEVVFFQGATAKIRSLVAAFEQRLGKRILVSLYCHLTGALGAALSLRDESIVSDAFVGIDLYRQEVPVRREVCRLCANHCKLTVADVAGEPVAFGFLCGRDYRTERFVAPNRSGFSLLASRSGSSRAVRKAIDDKRENARPMVPPAMILPIKLPVPWRPTDRQQDRPTIGIPDALYLVEDRPYWELFFDRLGYETQTSSSLRDPITQGKPHTGAEFCAPITALHGHVAALLEETDFVFLPNYLERTPDSGGASRKFCYYSHFSPALVEQGIDTARIISPIAASRYSSPTKVKELYRVLSRLPGETPSHLSIKAALDAAEEYRKRFRSECIRLYRENRSPDSEVDVVLLGRPYTVLSPAMNKSIPETFAALGVRTFYQDMLSYAKDDVAAIEPLLQEMNWAYGAKILKAAEVAARTPGLYPVFVTSFNCGPDSFIADYVRRILDVHDKPYLILELDEHDSSVGYETRIEAALRAFANHLDKRQKSEAPTVRIKRYEGVNPRYLTKIDRSKALVVPNWDHYAIPLVVAVLNGHGYRAILMEESDETIRRSLRWNNGQCIPMNALVEGFVDTLRNRNIEPSRALLWVPSGDFSCNIPLFPHHIEEILKSYGEGFEAANVYRGAITFVDLSLRVTADAYLAFMFGGLVRRIAERIRPYELAPGRTDAVIEGALDRLAALFAEGDGDLSEVIREIIDEFESIPRHKHLVKPQVALFGDVYVRDNRVMNQEVVRYIEANGGEVITMPYHEFARMTANTYFRRWVRNGNLGRVLTLKPMMAALTTLERWYYRHFERALGEPMPRYDENAEDILKRFGVRVDHEGESQDNLLKTWYLSRRYPDLTLFVQLNPGFCCAGKVTEAMTRRITEVTGVPVLSLTYDGTGGFKNDAILPYLRYATRRERTRERAPV